VIAIYRILFFPALMVLLPFLLLRMGRRGGYGAMMASRLGIFPAKRPWQKRPVWIHAVSVGEFQAVTSLAEALVDQGEEVVVTVTTSTAYRLGQQWAEKHPRRHVHGFPLDFWLFQVAAFRWIQPTRILIMEKEWWPELFHQAKKNKCPLYLITARLSAKSRDRLQRFPFLRKTILGAVHGIAACDPQDHDRFRKIYDGPLILSGNLKFDVSFPPAPDPSTRIAELQKLGLDAKPESKILLGSSTWPGEEEVLLSIWEKIHQRDPNWLLLLVPRHQERGHPLEKWLTQKQIPSWCRYSQRRDSTALHKVVLLDTTGMLRQVTALADLVFVGKSLPPHTKGQTPLESTGMAKATVMGSGYQAFQAFVDSLRQSGGIRIVGTPRELEKELIQLSRDERLRDDLGRKACTWFEQQKGSRRRTLEWLQNQA